MTTDENPKLRTELKVLTWTLAQWETGKPGEA